MRHLVDAHQQQLRQAQVQVDVAHPVEVRRLPGASPRSGCRIGASASHERERRRTRGAAAARAAAASAPRVNASAPPQNTGWPRDAAAQALVRLAPSLLAGAAAGRRAPARLSAPRHRAGRRRAAGRAASSRSDSRRTARRRPRRPGDDHAVVARELRDVVDRHADRVGDRLVLQPHHPRQEVEQVVAASAAARGARRRRSSAICARVVAARSGSVA